ncbi:MAG: iron-sulfur cluster repair di-iron protein [Microthrixaceae bacterium]|nr:iron-sulfur cluster repair di-iron protein [Microthrixaceae bacterium]
MSPSQTLAAIIDANPSAARILERHDLDYCCHGQRTLEAACAELNLDPAVVQAELDAAPATDRGEWTSMAPAEFVDHLEATHHRYLHEEMPRLAELAIKVRGVHGDRHPELHEVAATYLELQADLDPHLAKEEQVLFPMIRELTSGAEGATAHCGGIGNPIRVMMMEHDRAGELLAQLRKLTNGYQAPADGCASYQALYKGLEEFEADTHLHVHKENNVLFPTVLELDS